MFVLDEADEMLSRGFKDQIYDVFQKIPSSVQVRKRCILALCHHINSNKCGPQNKYHLYQQKIHVLISAMRQVQRSLDCRVGDHGCDSWDQTNTQGL